MSRSKLDRIRRTSGVVGYERWAEHFKAFHDLAACRLVATRLRYELRF